MSSLSHPRTRKDLRYVRQVMDGQVSYVVKDPVTLQYYRFGEIEAFLMQHMDGSRSLEALTELLRQEMGVDAGAASLEPFVKRLKEMGLAVRPPAEQRILLMEHVRRDRRLKLKGHGSTLLRMRFSLGDPDQAFERWVPRLRFFWTRGFVVVSLLAFLVYAGIVVAEWGPFTRGVVGLYSTEFYSGGTVLLLYFCIAVIIAIHELGHGLTCKRFGGEVHEMGAMLLYFMPAFYANVNDAWTFQRRAHRLWVTFAGGWIQLVVAAIAAVTWVLTNPETLIHQMAFFTVIFAGGLTLLLNFNPLIPLDGYYALMDWLEIPNLRPRSFAYMSAWTRRHLLRSPMQLPRATPRERRIFLTYGAAAVAYSGILLGSLALLAAGFLVDRFGNWGGVAAAGGAWLLFRQPLRKLFAGVRERAGGGRLERWGRVWGPKVAIGALLLAAIIGFTPWTLRVRVPAEVEPTQRLWLRSPEPARVVAIRAREGSHLSPGDTAVQLRSERLDLELAAARRAAAVAERQAAELRSGASAEALGAAELRVETAQTELANLQRREAALTLAAPFPALLVTPHGEERLGAGMAAGDSVVELWGERSRIRLQVPQRDAGGLRPGSAVKIRFPAVPGTTWRATVDRVAPAGRAGVVEAFATLPEEATAAGIRPGMSGRSKVEVGRTTVGGALLWWARRQVKIEWLL